MQPCELQKETTDGGRERENKQKGERKKMRSHVYSELV